MDDETQAPPDLEPSTVRAARPPVVVVTGPTASGKSGIAIELAESFRGEIVNADSMQVFRYMDIGTAKPSAAERTRVPHHLFDVVAPNEAYSAGRYAKEARAAAESIHERNHVVFLAGGTGLYIRAFLNGLIQTEILDPGLRKRLEDEQARDAEQGDPTRLHRRLSEFDAQAAAKIHPNDVRRTVRALEILEQSGQSASSVRAAHSFGDRPFRVLHLCIDPGREALVQRIELRTESMIEAGLLREVRDLRERGYAADLRPMQAIGYRHIQPVVDGADTLANALESMKVDTRRFARRQRTWIRPLPDVHWHDPDEPVAIFERVARFLESDDAADPSSSSA